MKKALLVTDVQNDFCSGGTLEVGGANEIIPIVNNLIEKYTKENKFIVATLDWHPSNHGSFASNSDGEIGS